MRTRELFWERALDRFEPADAVAWALEQLESASGTPALSTLAGLAKPYNAFEVEALLRDALHELNLREPTPEDGYRDFVCANVSDVLAGRMTASDACERLAGPYGVDLSRGELQSFWLLQWAVKDHLETGSQHYDVRFTGNNLPELMRIEAEKLTRGFCRDHREDAG
jgi:hypothetical protein